MNIIFSGYMCVSWYTCFSLLFFVCCGIRCLFLAAFFVCFYNNKEIVERSRNSSIPKVDTDWLNFWLMVVLMKRFIKIASLIKIKETSPNNALLSEKFNDSIAKHLKDLDKNLILYIIDHSIQFIAACVLLKEKGHWDFSSTMYQQYLMIIVFQW